MFLVQEFCVPGSTQKIVTPPVPKHVHFHGCTLNSCDAIVLTKVSPQAERYGNTRQSAMVWTSSEVELAAGAGDTVTLIHSHGC